MKKYLIAALHDTVHALDESLSNMKDEDIIEAEDLIDALIKVLSQHPEPVVANYEKNLIHNVEIKDDKTTL